MLDAQKLEFYGFFKQATTGDRAGAPPSSDPVEVAKWDAWGRCSGMRRRDAMQSFIALLSEGEPDWDSATAVGSTSLDRS